MSSSTSLVLIPTYFCVIKMVDPKLVQKFRVFAQRKASLTSEDLEEIGMCVQVLRDNSQEDPKTAEEFSQSIPFSMFQDLSILADSLLMTIGLETETTIKIFCNLCRFGRNAALYGKRTEDFMADSGFLLCVIRVLQNHGPKLRKLNSKAGLLLVRLAIQMVHNCIAENKEVAKKMMMQHDLFETILETFLTFDDEKTRVYVANLGCRIVILLGYGFNGNVIITGRKLEVLDIIMKNWHVNSFKFWLDRIIISDKFIPMMFANVDFEKEVRVKVLRTILQRRIGLTDEGVMCIRDEFKQQAKIVVDSKSCQVQKFITTELSSLVSLLSELCVENNPKPNFILRNDDLLVNLANRLLKIVHFAGEQSTNSLSALEKIDEVKKAMEDLQLYKSPLYQFKSNLIRLIGNLAYKHELNQNMALELETLPIILECIRIDGRKPFAPQGAVFAMKLLLHGSRENLKYVAQLNKKAMAKDSDNIPDTC